MSGRIKSVDAIKCRQARKGFAALSGSGSYRKGGTTALTEQERSAVKGHIERCARCAGEYRLLSLERSVLDAAAADEPMVPRDHFFTSLRVRIAREAEDNRSHVAVADELWSAVVWVTARQLIPVLAMLLLLIIGATVLWGNTTPGRNLQRAAVPPRDRLLFNEVYEYPQPTTDDVLDSLVAVEENQNGK